MAETNVLDAARRALRLTSHAHDGEIETLIAAARGVMVNSGVKQDAANDDTNDVVRVAILAFVKANFGLDNAEAERLQASFESMVTQLKMTQGYGQELT